MATVKKAKTNLVPTSAQNQINKQIAESKAKSEQELAEKRTGVNSQGSTAKEQIAEVFDNTANTVPAASTDIDPTIQRQATTQGDVDAQDTRTRLWQSLGYTYGNQIRESDKSYDQAIAEADRQALSRGMQRSSYNNQTLANLANQKIEAQNNIRAGQIAEYQKGIGDLEQQEEEKRRWEIQQAFNERQFDYQQKSDDQKIAYNYVMAMIEKGQRPSDDLLARAGLSTADVNTILSNANKSGGGTPYWASLGFNSEKDYGDARRSGLNADQYYDKGDNTTGLPNVKPTDQSVNASLFGTPAKRSYTNALKGAASAVATAGKASNKTTANKDTIKKTTK